MQKRDPAEGNFQEAAEKTLLAFRDERSYHFGPRNIQQQRFLERGSAYD
jgi:hypothetical protein